MKTSQLGVMLCLGSEMNELDISRDHQMRPYFGGDQTMQQIYVNFEGLP